MQVLYKQVFPKPGRPLKMFTKYFHAPKQAVTYCGQLNLILNVISQGTYTAFNKLPDFPATSGRCRPSRHFVTRLEIRKQISSFPCGISFRCTMPCQIV